MVSITRNSNSIDARIAWSCLPGFPVTNRRYLREAGVGRAAIARRLQDGRLSEPWPDTFLVGVEVEHAPRDVVRAAAVVTVGPNSALDGTSALIRYGLWTRPEETIQVVGDRWRPRVPTPSIWFHRVPPGQPLRVYRADAIPTRHPVDALFAAGRTLTAHELANVIQRGEYERHYTLELLNDELRIRRGRHGSSTVQRALELRRGGSSGTKSRSEERLRPYVTAMFGEPLVNVFGAAGMPDYEPDFCWPERRWIVEVDGGHHDDDPAQRAKDVARDELLRLTGWIVVRVRYGDIWRDVDAVVERIRRELAAHRAEARLR